MTDAELGGNLARTRAWRDKRGDLVAEWPTGSGDLVLIDSQVLGRVAEKFGSTPTGGLSPAVFGDMEELMTVGELQRDGVLSPPQPGIPIETGDS